MRNAYEADLDRIEAASHEGGLPQAVATAITVLGVGATIFATAMGASYLASRLMLIGTLSLGLLVQIAMMVRANGRSSAALHTPPTALRDVIAGSEEDVVVKGRLEMLPEGRGWLLRDPESPDVVAWIDTIELEAWRTSAPDRWRQMASDALPQRAEVIVAATTGSAEHIPQTLLDGLEPNGYRRPLRVVRLTGGRRAPVGIGVMPDPVREAPKVRVVIEESEADAERGDVEGGAGVVGQRAQRRLQRE